MCRRLADHGRGPRVRGEDDNGDQSLRDSLLADHGRGPRVRGEDDNADQSLKGSLLADHTPFAYRSCDGLEAMQPQGAGLLRLAALPAPRGSQ